jgi:hypothetical protein
MCNASRTSPAPSTPRVSSLRERAVARYLGGERALRAYLEKGGFVAERRLTTETMPFNLFARVASGAMKQPNMKVENEWLGSAGSRFVICSNRLEHDEHWDRNRAEWVGKASMGKHRKRGLLGLWTRTMTACCQIHPRRCASDRFRTIKDLTWQWFNPIAFALEGDAASLRGAIELVEAMTEAARVYVNNAGMR